MAKPSTVSISPNKETYGESTVSGIVGSICSYGDDSRSTVRVGRGLHLGIFNCGLNVTVFGLFGNSERVLACVYL